MIIWIILIGLILAAAVAFFINKYSKFSSRKSILISGSLILLSGAILMPGIIFPEPTPYEIIGDTVQINDSRALIQVTPYEINGDGDIKVTLMSKNYTGGIYAAAIFNNNIMTLSNPRRVVEQTVIEPMSLSCPDNNGTMYWTAKKGIASCYWSSNDYLYWNHSFESYDLATDTIFWNETITKEVAIPITKTIGYRTLNNGKTVRFFENIQLTTMVPKTFLFHLDIVEDSEGKYDFVFWPSNYGLNISAATNDDKFILLDPWYNDTAHGTFCNPSTESTNSSDYLVYENFEGTGTPSGWSCIGGSGCNYDYTAAVFAGTKAFSGTGNFGSHPTITRSGVQTWDYWCSSRTSTVVSCAYIEDNLRSGFFTSNLFNHYANSDYNGGTYTQDTFYHFAQVVDWVNDNSSLYIYDNSSGTLLYKSENRAFTETNGNPFIVNIFANEAIVDNFRVYSGTDCPLEPVANTAPVMTTPINTSEVVENADAEFQSNYSDAEGEAGNVTFYYFVDGVSVFNDSFTNQANNTVINSTIVSGNYSGNQNLSLIVESFDGTDYGVNVTMWVNVTTVISNTPPSLTTPINTSVVYNNTDLEWQTTVTDDDGNVTNITFYTSVDGSLINTQTFINQVNATQINATVNSGNFTTFQNVSVVVEAYDGEDYATNITAWLNVSNRVPTVSSYINSTSSFQNATVDFWCYVEDEDANTINVSWIVDKNSTQVSTGSTGFLANGTNQSVYSLTSEANYDYTIACTPNDGYESGTQVNSTSSLFSPINVGDYSLCVNVTDVQFFANISKGTINYTSLVYSEADILAKNSSYCGYTYILNTTGAVATTYKFWTNLSNPNSSLKINGTVIDYLTNYTVNVPTEELIYLNITLNYSLFPLTTSEIPFTLNITNSVT